MSVRSIKLYDRIMQAIGLLVLSALTVALLIAAADGLLPLQKDGETFDAVYAWHESAPREDIPEEESGEESGGEYGTENS